MGEGDRSKIIDFKKRRIRKRFKGLFGFLDGVRYFIRKAKGRRNRHMRDFNKSIHH